MYMKVPLLCGAIPSILYSKPMCGPHTALTGSYYSSQKNFHASARSFIPWVGIPTSQCDFSFVLCAVKTTGSAEA